MNRNNNNNMSITLKQLRNLEACKPAIKWFKNQKETNILNLYTQLKNDEFANLDWGIWLATRLLNKEQNQKLIIFSAELVLHIFEKKYPKDDRPRKAIEAAKKYISNPTKKNEDISVCTSFAADRATTHASDAAAVFIFSTLYCARAAHYAARAASITVHAVIDDTLYFANKVINITTQAAEVVAHTASAAAEDAIATTSMLVVGRIAYNARREIIIKILDYAIELLEIKLGETYAV